MNKDQFLALAGELYEKSNPSNISYISLDKDTYDEIVDQISSEINDAGVGLIDNYELTMYSREVELESVDFSLTDIENTVKDVLNRYFKTI